MIQFRDMLNETELAALRRLLNASNAADNTAYSLPDDADLYWLYYGDSSASNQPEAILCAYHMGEMHNGLEIDELLCFTLPPLRGQGRFRRLFRAAKPLLRPSLRFCVQENSTARDFLSHMNARFEHEEQLMELSLDRFSEKTSGEQQDQSPVPDFPLSFVKDGPVLHVTCRYGECSLYPQGSRCYLFGVLVYERFRGKHYGSRLLGSVLSGLRSDGFSSVYLEVASDNLPAVRLYQNCGFRITERLSYYYME